jgi:hypothetical protein
MWLMMCCCTSNWVYVDKSVSLKKHFRNQLLLILHLRSSILIEVNVMLIVSVKSALRVWFILWRKEETNRQTNSFTDENRFLRLSVLVNILDKIFCLEGRVNNLIFFTANKKEKIWETFFTSYSSPFSKVTTNKLFCLLVYDISRFVNVLFSVQWLS